MPHSTKTIKLNVGSAINALSLSKDNTRIVAAGRSVLKIYQIDEFNGFHDPINLHVGRKQGLNMACSDVAWSHVDDNLIATAATNGAIVAWDLTAPGRDKKLAVLTEHRRTVTKVSFHNSESNLLLSGSQDGSMKLFDLRNKECVMTLESKADGVRSVQFNPHQYFFFAASFDNGNVQVWDYRHKNSAICQFLAHKGSVYTLDWHQDPKHTFRLATGGRDNMVKVWSVEGSKQKEINNIPTMSSVACLKWRPQHVDQLATVSMMLDFSVNVWHLKRKYVSFAHFADHRDSPTGIAWKQTNPNIIFSCAKDGSLIMHSMRDALCPAENSISRGLAAGPSGHLAHSSQVLNSTPRAQSPSGLAKLGSLFGGWKQGGGDFDGAISSGSSSPTMVSARTSNFLNCTSRLSVFSNSLPVTDGKVDSVSIVTEHLSMKQFAFAAKNYELDGATSKLPFRELCAHNSAVAEQAGFLNASRTWKLLGELFAKDVLLNKTPGADKQVVDSMDKLKKLELDGKRHSLTIKKDELHGSQITSATVSGCESEHQSDDNRIEVEDYVTVIAKGRHSEPDIYTDDENFSGFAYNGLTSEAEFLSEHEFGFVPSEAFEQREDLDLDAIAKFGHIDAPSGINTDTDNEKRILTAHGGRWHEKVIQRGIESSSSPSPPVDDKDSDPLANGVFNVKPTLWPSPLDSIREEIACKQLRFFASSNDVQSAVCMMLAMTSYPSAFQLSINEEEAELWQNNYLDQLAGRELWVQHAQVIKLSRLPSIRSLSASCNINIGCSTCQRRMPPSNPWSCDRRNDPEHANRPVLCFLCQLQVRGLYTFCQGCTFGGHTRCVLEWRRRERTGKSPERDTCERHRYVF